MANQQLANPLSDAVMPQNLQSAFDAFNLGEHVGDCPNVVARNRKSLHAYLPKKTKIQWLEQVHGNSVVDVIKHQAKPIVADAAITRCRHIALAIMTADCLPICLFYCRIERVVKLPQFMRVGDPWLAILFLAHLQICAQKIKIFMLGLVRVLVPRILKLV